MEDAVNQNDCLANHDFSMAYASLALLPVPLDFIRDVSRRHLDIVPNHKKFNPASAWGAIHGVIDSVEHLQFKPETT